MNHLVIGNFQFWRTGNLRSESNFKKKWFVNRRTSKMLKIHKKCFIFGLFQNHVSIVVEQQEYGCVPVKVSFTPTICQIAASFWISLLRLQPKRWLLYKSISYFIEKAFGFMRKNPYYMGISQWKLLRAGNSDIWKL